MGRKPKGYKEDIKYPGVRSENDKHTYRYSVPKPGGGRKQKETPSFPSAKEAFDAGILIKAEIANGTYVDEQNIFFTDWCDKWLEMYEASGKVKPVTVDNRRSCLETAREYFKDQRLKDITKVQYQEFLNSVKKKGLLKSTIVSMHSPMRMLFAKAVDSGVIKSDVTSGIDLPSFRRTVQEIESNSEVPKFLEKESLALLLRTARDSGESQLFHILFVLAYTGMRVGEACALKTSDIDEVNRKISITKTLYDKKGINNFTLGTPKTKSSIRKVDFSESTLKILALQAAWRKEFKFSKGRDFYSKEEFIFVNEHRAPGKPMNIGNVERFMKKILEKADLPISLTPHSLRHTYTSLMVEAKLELSAIQKLLGHQNDRVTELVYLHLTESKKREAVEKLDDLMKGLI